MSKNIGGSIFASSSPEILRPLPFDGGNLIVVPDEIADTHRLEFHKGKIKTVLASHPNGYSCRSLAEKIAAKEPDKIIKQAAYIIACGGDADLTLIANAKTERAS